MGTYQSNLSQDQEEKLRRSQQNFHSLFDQTTVGVAITDAYSGEFLRVNHRFCEILGYSEQEMNGVIFQSITHPDDMKVSLDKVQLLQSGAARQFSMEKRYIRKDGSTVWVDLHATVMWEPGEEPSCVSVVILDINDRKRAEEALQHSHDLMSYIIEHNRSAVAVHDRDLKYIYVSQRYLDDYNVKEKDVIGRHHYDVFPDLPQKWRDVHQKALLGEISSGEDDPYEREDGSIEWTRWECRPWYEADGSIGGFVIYTEVITERKRIEAKLREQLAELRRWQTVTLEREDRIQELKSEVNALLAEAGKPARYGKTASHGGESGRPDSPAAGQNLSQKELETLLAEAERSRRALLSVAEDQKEAEDRARLLNQELERRVKERTTQLESVNQGLETFSYSVSHDLRAPLRSMEGFSQALLDDYSGQLDERGRDYLARIQAASRRMSLLIQDLLNLSRVTRAEFNRQLVDLSALTRSICDELKAQAPERQITVEIDPQLQVYGDASLLKIALENLLSNAFKFTGKQAQAAVQAGMREQSGERVYYVRDNGAGFDMAYAAKLFAPFQRLHGANDFPGTGVGLSIVKRVVARHGGRIWAESQVGQGSTFYFTLDSWQK